MTIPNHYDIGDEVTVAAEFKSPSGSFIDPTTVSFKIKDPAGVVTVYVYLTNGQLVRDSLGKYHVNVDAATVGKYYYRFFSTGSGKAAAEGSFVVDRSNF
jgi:hypothetical protein